MTVSSYIPVNLPPTPSFLKWLLFLALITLSIFIIVALERAQASKPSEMEWLIVNYWATWCGPCRDEIPELNTLATSQPGTLRVLGVNFDNPLPVQQTIDEKTMGVEFTTIRREQATQMGLQTPASLPTTYLLNYGKLIKSLSGPQTQASIESAIQLAIQESLEEQPPTNSSPALRME